jgi:hypothetical protein
VLFFYPLDFTFVCPTELIAFSEAVKSFKLINCNVLAASTGTLEIHKYAFFRKILVSKCFRKTAKVLFQLERPNLGHPTVFYFCWEMIGQFEKNSKCLALH